MRRVIATVLVVILAGLPAAAVAGELTVSDLSIPEYRQQFVQLAYCSKWEQQCKEDPFDPGKVECTQHCSQYTDDDNGGSRSSSDEGGGSAMGPVQMALGVVIVVGVLWWALSIK